MQMMIENQEQKAAAGTDNDAVIETLRSLVDELEDGEILSIPLEGVLNLKTNGQPINLNICSVGTLDSSVVSPREIFKSCILSNSAAFVALHLCEASHKCNYA